MTETLSSADLLRLRMRAQLLTRGAGEAVGLSMHSGPLGRPGHSEDSEDSSTSRAERVAAVAQRMLAMQGQDWLSSRWALGVRAPGTTAEDVNAAFNGGLLVRSWPMRGTIHVVAAEDIGWIQGVAGHRVLAGAPKRREFLGLSDAALEALVEAAVAALRGGRSLDRDGLSEVWTEAGLEWKSNWRYHVIWWMCQNGITTLGPVAGGEPRIVLAEEWIGEPRRFADDEALAELAARYVAPRGPASAKDFAWWTGLTVREARRGLELAVEAERLVPATCEEHAAGALWMDPELLGDSPGGAGGASSGSAADPVPEWLLLPSFDEHLLGYTDRTAQLAPAHFDRIVPGRNGMFLATAVHRGRVVGTWKRGTRKAEGLNITPLPGEALDASALAPEAELWGAFHGREATPVAVL